LMWLNVLLRKWYSILFLHSNSWNSARL